MQHFVTDMCIHVHISVTKYSILDVYILLQNSASQDICQLNYGTCEMLLSNPHKIFSFIKINYKFTVQDIFTIPPYTIAVPPNHYRI